MKGAKALLFLALLGCWGEVSQGALSRTYPTANTTALRWDAYVDGLKTILLSTYTVNLSLWQRLGTVDATVDVFDPNQTLGLWVDAPDYLSSSKVIVHFDGNQDIVRWLAIPLLKSSGTISPGVKIANYETLDSTNTQILIATCSLQDFTNWVISDVKRQVALKIADDDMEQYMIIKSTVPYDNYKGFYDSIAPNGKHVPISCVELKSKTSWQGTCP